MRTVSIQENYMKPILINGLIVKEDFKEINENKLYKLISVTVQQFDNEDYMIREIQHTIEGDKYELLMSESPDFAAGKPKNEYREIDLWYVIDLIREENKTV